MLSRTAANLFWIARYMERVETMARLLEVGYRISLMPNAGQGHRNEWESILAASGNLESYQANYTDVKQVNIENFLFFSLDNPASIASCIAQARDNARIVRTAMTREVWDAMNGAFQEMKYHVLLPTTDMVGGALDNFQWTTLLRSLSAFRSFHWAYGGNYHPTKKMRIF